MVTKRPKRTRSVTLYFRDEEWERIDKAAELNDEEPGLILRLMVREYMKPVADGSHVVVRVGDSVEIRRAKK